MRGAPKRVLWICLILNGGFLIVELVAGRIFHSLALMADAAHMTSDVAGLVIALIAATLVTRAPTQRHTFGLLRAEVLGGQLNGLLLLAGSAWIVFEALQRLGEPESVDGAGMLLVATIGLVINLACTVALARSRNDDLNMQGAFLHMALDAAGSVGAIAAGLAVRLWGLTWADPVASLLIAALVIWSAYVLLRTTTRILLESAPTHLEVEAIEAVLSAEPAVSDVHHVHLWAIGSRSSAMSGHVVLGAPVTLAAAQVEGDRLKELLRERFGITHATLELECDPCGAPSHDG